MLLGSSREFVGLDASINRRVVARMVRRALEFMAELARLSAIRTPSPGRREARGLYEWFLPLLRLDVVPKFVQLIKLVQQEVGMGSERVRPPRLTLEGRERDEALALIRERLAAKPRG
jgi:dihydrodipicolinate synthase/N-acetylneuraminate lyase